MVMPTYRCCFCAGDYQVVHWLLPDHKVKGGRSCRGSGTAMYYVPSKEAS